jgi:hypothetical protein
MDPWQREWLDYAGARCELLIGDAAFTPGIYLNPAMEELPDLQQSDHAAWAGSLGRIRGMAPDRIHFCHDTTVLQGAAESRAV